MSSKNVAFIILFSGRYLGGISTWVDSSVRLVPGLGELDGTENSGLELSFTELRRIGGYLIEEGLNLLAGLEPKLDEPFQ